MTTSYVEQAEREYAEPLNDWLLLRRIAHEELSAGGIDLSMVGKSAQDIEWMKSDKARKGHVQDRDIRKHESNQTNRYQVLAVGPGEYVDVSDEHRDNVFMRRPMQCQVGDVVLIREGVRDVVLDGETLSMARDYQCLARVIDHGLKTEKLDVLNNYVFCGPAREVALSKGGIAIVTDEASTGFEHFNDRFEVLGVGEGAWALKFQRGKPPVFDRRPMPVEVGDVFTAEGVGFSVAVKGMSMICLTANQVSSVIRRKVAAS